MVLSSYGKKELRNVLGSELVNSWQETDRSLQGVVRLLLGERDDLLKLYFPDFTWQQLQQQPLKQKANIILALFKAQVIALHQDAVADTPQMQGVQSFEQALFYMGTFMPSYMDEAIDWCESHPDTCPKKLKRPERATLSLTDYLDAGS